MTVDHGSEDPTSLEVIEDDSITPRRTLDSFLEDAHNSHPPVSLSVFHTWRYWFIMLSLGVANSSDASEILCLSYVLSDDSFQTYMLQHTKWRAGLLAGSVFFGMLLGGLLVGTLGDWVGRRPILMVGLLCNAIAGILSAASTDALQLSLLRGIAGVGIGATVPPLFTLVTELAPPSRRGFFVTVAASFWMVGSIYVALVALCTYEYLNQSWRVFALSCALPSALGAVLVWSLVPESPRFLALQGKLEEACTVANRLAQAMEYRGVPLSQAELVEQYPLSRAHSVAFSRSRASSSTLIVRLSAMASEAWSDFVAGTSTLYTPSLRSTTWPLQLVWFSLSFGSYGILTWINSIFVAVHLDNVYWNALLFASGNLPGNILSAYLMDRTGRSVLLITSCLLAALSLLSFAWCARGNALEKQFGIVSSACAFQAFSISAWNTVDCMTSELFPTTVRSTGMGVCAASGRVGAMVAQFINGMLMGSPVSLLLVASGSLALAATTPCLLPGGTEMSQQPLQDEVNGGTISAQAMMDTLVQNEGVFGKGDEHAASVGDGASYTSLDRQRVV
jgi:VNT family MFS transporter (synaptic vesicle glycoprotein 2)